MLFRGQDVISFGVRVANCRRVSTVIMALLWWVVDGYTGLPRDFLSPNGAAAFRQ